MNKKTIHNPFLLQGYKSPKYFCDREKETKSLISAIENGRNITLIANRRLGKTGLIKHAFHYLTKKKNHQCYYVDIMACQNLADFTKVITFEILGKLHNGPLQILKEAAGVLRHIKAQVTFDQDTGKPQLQIGIDNAQDAEKTLDELFRYLGQSRKSKNIVIAIDEFQQILKFPEKNMEAVLRSFYFFRKPKTHTARHVRPCQQTFLSKHGNAEFKKNRPCKIFEIYQSFF